MQRLVICGILAVVYFMYTSKGPVNPSPNPQPSPAPAPSSGLAEYARSMTAADRAALRDAYTFLAKGLEADPQNEPVFARVDQVRQGHRAALLLVWQAMDNNPNKYPGLGGKLDALLKENIGDTDVPLSPPTRERAVSLFRSIAEAFR